MLFTVIFSLLFIIVLIYLALKLLQRYVYFGGNKALNMRYVNSMNILATVYVDSNNKIIKFDNNNTHYVILVSKNNNLLLDKYEELNQNNSVS
jgi:flagellar biogenesis protein FliO